ncbi:hypothetical protein V1512DRAFT_266150 [Lipomyces arxii]|uniref:uncharacterized protein n=1 Tax=Lipomyces arxii TaxID=56418 RepID=UPI0034CD9EAB
MSHQHVNDDVPLDPHMLYASASSAATHHHSQDDESDGDDVADILAQSNNQFEISSSVMSNSIAQPADGSEHEGVSLTSTEQVMVYHCPVPNCPTKTYAKRGRRAILRHLKTRTDSAHSTALEQFGKGRATMTKRERSRKTSAIYREKHNYLSQQQAEQVGEPYLAPLYNPVLVKKHEAYVRKKIRTALDSVENPVWPTAPGQSHQDTVSATLLHRHLKSMENNVLWILQEMDNSIYFPAGSDIPRMLARDGGDYYRRRLRELEERFPAREQQFQQAARQLDNPELLERAIVEFQVWKKQDDLARAKSQLDRERYERECADAMNRIEEYDRERTEEGINEKVNIEMDRWREKMAKKLREQWQSKHNLSENINSSDAAAVAAQVVAAGVDHKSNTK